MLVAPLEGCMDENKKCFRFFIHPNWIEFSMPGNFLRPCSRFRGSLPPALHFTGIFLNIDCGSKHHTSWHHSLRHQSLADTEHCISSSRALTCKIFEEWLLHRRSDLSWGKVQKYADLLAAHHLSGNYYAPHQYFSLLNQ